MLEKNMLQLKSNYFVCNSGSLLGVSDHFRIYRHRQRCNHYSE